MRSGFLGGGIGPTAIKQRGGLAAPVPVAGAELLNDGGFDDASRWVLVGGTWSIAGGVLAAAGGTYGECRQLGITAAGTWVQITAIMSLSGTFELYANGNKISSAPANIAIGRSNGTGARILFAGNPIGTIDNASLKSLTLISLFSTRTYGSANCDLSAAITRTAGTQAGFVARLDSATSPANFIIAYLDGAGNVKVDKCVGGTYTNIISGAVTYGSTKILRLVCSGNNVSAYYDGAQVGSTVTVSDAGITGNKNHGLFSTYVANTFSGYTAA